MPPLSALNCGGITHTHAPTHSRQKWPGQPTRHDAPAYQATMGTTSNVDSTTSRVLGGCRRTLASPDQHPITQRKAEHPLTRHVTSRTVFDASENLTSYFSDAVSVEVSFASSSANSCLCCVANNTRQANAVNHPLTTNASHVLPPYTVGARASTRQTKSCTRKHADTDTRTDT